MQHSNSSLHVWLFLLGTIITGISLIRGGMGQHLAVQGASQPTPSVEALDAAIARAEAFSGTQNADWIPVEAEIDGVWMVLVPVGCFMMGDTEEQREATIAQCVKEGGGYLCELDDFSTDQKAHQICFDEPFWIDKYEMTNAQFDSLWYIQAAEDSGGTEPNQPRTNITWFEARDACERRGAHLPTEAQWEYAARGVESWEYPWGSEFISENTSWDHTSSNTSQSVGSFPAGNSWVGASDMSGNAWEWIQDWYDKDYYNTLPEGAVNPTGPQDGETHPNRGGAYSVDLTFYLRSANRVEGLPFQFSPYGGFRCARAIEE